MSNKENKQVKIISIVVVLTLIGKVLGLARDMLLGYYFATGMESNAFLTASRIPRNFFDIIFASAISSSFIPVFNEYLEKKGKKDAFKLASAFITVVAVLTVAISGLGIAFSSRITAFLADGFDSETASLCSSLLKIMFPAVIFTGLAFCIVGMLQSFGEFNIPSLLSTATNVIIIAYYLFFRKSFGITGLAVAFLIGWAAQLIMQLPSLGKLGYRYSPSLRHEGLKKIFLLMLPILVSTWAQPVNAMIAGKFASHLNGGAATSAYDYANTLYTMVAGVVVLSISNVVFPEFSRMSIKGDSSALKDSLKSTLSGMMLILVPMSFGLCAVATPLIRLFYERGAWGEESTELTGTALAVMSLGMIAYGLQIILSRVFYAEQKSLIPLVSGIVSVAGNYLLCVYLSPVFGIAGLAAASVISLVLSILVLLKAADIRYNGLVDTKGFIDILKIFVSGLVMGAAVYFCSKLLYSHLEDGFISRCIVLFAPVLLGVIIYAVLILILGVDIVKKIDISGKFKNSGIFSAYKKICVFFGNAWKESAIVSFICNPQGRLWNDETKPLGFWSGLSDAFCSSRLKNLFTGSIFLQPFAWCALALFAAPILPTMLELALCMAGYFSVILTSLYENKTSIRKNPLTGLLAAYALVFIMATIFSEYITDSIMVCVLTVAFVMFSVVLYYSVDSKKQLEGLIDIVIFAGAAVSCYGILQYLFGWGYQSSSWVDEEMFSSIGFRVTSTLENPNMLGQYLILTIPLAVARFLSSKGLKKLYYLGILGVMVVCIVLTFSRGAWLGLMFAAFVFVALWKPQLLLLLPFALVALYFVLPDTIVSRFTSIGNLSDNSTSFRVSIWISSIKMLADGKWLLGIGPGNDVFTKVFALYAQDLVTAPHSHNLFIQLAIEGGVILLALFIVIILVFLRQGFAGLSKLKDPASRLEAIGCISAVLGFLLQGMTDYSFYNKRLMLIFWMFLSIGILMTKRNKLSDGGLFK